MATNLRCYPPCVGSPQSNLGPSPPPYRPTKPVKRSFDVAFLMAPDEKLAGKRREKLLMTAESERVDEGKSLSSANGEKLASKMQHRLLMIAGGDEIVETRFNDEKIAETQRRLPIAGSDKIAERSSHMPLNGEKLTGELLKEKPNPTDRVHEKTDVDNRIERLMTFYDDRFTTSISSRIIKTEPETNERPPNDIATKAYLEREREAFRLVPTETLLNERWDTGQSSPETARRCTGSAFTKVRSPSPCRDDPLGNDYAPRPSQDDRETFKVKSSSPDRFLRQESGKTTLNLVDNTPAYLPRSPQLYLNKFPVYQANQHNLVRAYVTESRSSGPTTTTNFFPQTLYNQVDHLRARSHVFPHFAYPNYHPLAAAPGNLLTLNTAAIAAFTLPAQNICAKCNVGFRMTSDLVYHMRSNHKADGVTCDMTRRKERDKLKCDVCNESFRERHHLTRHMTAHQDKEGD